MSEELIQHGADRLNAEGTLQETSSGDGIITLNLLHYVRHIVKGRLLIVAWTLSSFLLSTAIALILTPWYSAQAVFLPPVKMGAASSMPTMSSLMQQDMSDTYLGMLSSQTVADDVIEQMGLMTVFKARKRSDARAALAGASKFNLDKNSLISVTVKSKDPVLAAGIANAYLEALYRLNGKMAESASSHRATFFEAQIAKEREKLSTAETDLEQTQVKTGVILPQGEAEAGITAIVQLQTSIGTTEARLAALRQAATEENPEVRQVQSELAALRAQLAQRTTATKMPTRSQGIASKANLPSDSLEYMRKAREVKLQEEVYATLVQEYEKAQLAASDPGPQLQIVDHAIVPDRKAGPPRTLIVLIGTAAGFMLGILWTLISSWLIQFWRAVFSQP